jgi:hypothetical protein
MLEITWKRERAAFRAETIDVFSDNLTPDDQPFLDAALEDRAQPVQERAETLLIRIPGSGPAREAKLRAEPLIGKRLGFQIVIRPPDDATAPSGVERATAMIQAIGRVPPSHWVIKLGKQPADLVKTIARDRDWGFSVLIGWTQAAITFKDAEWAAALWPFWLMASTPHLGMAAKIYAGSFEATVNQHLIGLLQIMRSSDAERSVANTIADSFDPIRMAIALPYLARPWSADLTDRYLRSFRDLADMALKQTQVNWQAINAWTASFQTAALAIPAGSIGSAIMLLSRLRDADPRHGTDYRWESWKQTLRSYIETLQMRQRIIEEIPG